MARETPGPKPEGIDQHIALRHALAGVQASVFGVLLMFIALMIGSVWHGRSVWVVPNLFATTFFGANAYRNHLLYTSWAGIALTMAFYGVLGAIWGCIWRERSVRWLGAYGAITGLVLYFFLYHYVWRHLNPMVTLYAPDRQLELGHVLWGMILARSPLYARRIARAELPPQPLVPPEPPALPAVDQEVSPAVSSGELIQ